MIIKCVKIGISKDAIMQFINKALEIGLLDKERFTNIKEITTALLDKRYKVPTASPNNKSKLWNIWVEDAIMQKFSP